MPRNSSIAYKYVSAERLIKFLERPSLRFTPPSALNDLFEYRPKITGSNSLTDDIHLNDDVVGVVNTFLAQMSVHLGLCALSRDPTNVLMWSHYADCHRGAAIGFDLEHDFFRSFELIDVIYSNRRPEIGIECLITEGFQPFDAVSLDWMKLTTNRPDLIATKSSDWAYEKEVRLVKHFDKPTLEQAQKLSFAMGATRRTGSLELNMTQQIEAVPASAVVSIVLGAKHQVAFADEGLALLSDTNVGLEERVRARIENNQALDHVKIRRAHAEFDTYQISVFDPLKSDEAKRYLHPIEAGFYEQGVKGGVSQALADALRAQQHEMKPMSSPLDSSLKRF